MLVAGAGFEPTIFAWIYKEESDGRASANTIAEFQTQKNQL